MSRTAPIRAWVVASTFLLLVSACGDDDGGILGGATSSTTTTVADETTTTAGQTTGTTKAPGSTTATTATTAAGGKTTPAPTTTVVLATIDLDTTLPANYGELSLDAGFVPDPYTIEMTAGGPVDAFSVGCAGFVTDAPDLEFMYDGGDFLRFYFEGELDGDTTMVVNGPDGQWWCGDDSFETYSPTIDFAPAPAGVYDIWIGTYYAEETIFGEFSITEVDANSPGGQGGVVDGGNALDPTLPANFGEESLNAGFPVDPHEVVITAGGGVDAASVGCIGFVAEAPDYELTWDGSDFLRFYFVANDLGDTTLVVNDPNGEWWCADDSYGTQHPTLDLAPAPAGVYDIWVGTYNADEYHGGFLYVTEVDGNHP